MADSDITMAINRATFSVTGNALELMVLEKSDPPPAL
jgi:hypothetical protein